MVYFFFKTTKKMDKTDIKESRIRCICVRVFEDSKRVCVCICACICMFMFTYVYMYVCNVCMYVCMHIHVPCNFACYKCARNMLKYVF